MRRVVGYDVQYMGTLEPQRRLAPHLHVLIRGTSPRADLRQIVAATYHQVWWPSTDTVRYDGRHLPVWNEESESYLDPDTGEALLTRDEALDALDGDDDDEPSHVVRFGSQLRIEGVLAGSPQADRCIGYVAKYLTKDIGSIHDPDEASPRMIEHHDRLWRALRYEPCSPTCANWLRYGIQPRSAKAGLTPGYCKGKVHRRETLGFAAASWSPASGPARPWPTTGPTAGPGCATCSVFPTTPTPTGGFVEADRDRRGESVRISRCAPVRRADAQTGPFRAGTQPWGLGRERCISEGSPQIVPARCSRSLPVLLAPTRDLRRADRSSA